jgi:hypothetical protein
MTREERLNNPCGIKLSPQKFQGEVISDDAVFKMFDTMANGVRAAAKVLLTYYNIHNLDTVSTIIYRWAPSLENDVTSYITNVCDMMGVSPDGTLDLTDQTIMVELVKAIIFHENGSDIVDDITITQGVADAYSE